MNFTETESNPIEYNYGPRSVAVGDFNNDTWLDMVVANSIVNKIAIYLGDSDGTFSKQIEYLTGSGSAPNMVAVSDFNNDSVLDIAVANFGTNNIYWSWGWIFWPANRAFNCLISSDFDHGS
jgi:hypothetical protein